MASRSGKLEEDKLEYSRCYAAYCETPPFSNPAISAVGAEESIRSPLDATVRSQIGTLRVVVALDKSFPVVLRTQQRALQK